MWTRSDKITSGNEVNDVNSPGTDSGIRNG